MKLNLTQAQNLLLQAMLTILVGAATTALTAGYQLLAAHGQVDPSQLPLLPSWVFNTFLIAVGRAIAAYIPAHIPQELQALKDTQQQLADGQQEILSIVNGFTAPRPVVKPLTGPTAIVPAFTPPVRPVPIQATTLPDVPQQTFPVAPPAQPLPPDTGG